MNKPLAIAMPGFQPPTLKRKRDSQSEDRLDSTKHVSKRALSSEDDVLAGTEMRASREEIWMVQW